MSTPPPPDHAPQPPLAEGEREARMIAQGADPWRYEELGIRPADDWVRHPETDARMRLWEVYLPLVQQVMAPTQTTLAQMTRERDAAVAEGARLREALPKGCDGKEQPAFEEWAKDNRYDMTEHPLHYLFLDSETYAARAGWRAAIDYCRKSLAATSVPEGGK